MAVWRLHVNTGGKSIAQYCLQNNVAAMGWSLDHLTAEERKSIKTFEDYKVLADQIYTDYNSVIRLHDYVKENDIIWMRSADEGKYYFGRVASDSKWVFNESAVGIDAANQLTNIHWYPASITADEESVPGAITTAFIRGTTFQRIHKYGIEDYSRMLYNMAHKSEEKGFKYPDINLELNEETFYSLLQPEDVEDLLSLWLFDKYGYVCIPSTNKISTPKYECVLLDPGAIKRKHIYLQVKKGKIDIHAADYKNLNGDVYLLTTEGQVIGVEKYPNIYSVSATDIYSFAIDPEKANIIPENILFWIKFMTDVENINLPSDSNKGIMFDTNLSYSATNELEMLSENKVSAYGAAKRFVNSFLKGDYVLFYSKGKGIIAVGRIKSDSPVDKGDERYHDVDMILPESMPKDISVLPALSPSEIKTILGRNFYLASTIKTPFLNKSQVEKLVNALNQKYN